MNIYVQQLNYAFLKYSLLQMLPSAHSPSLFCEDMPMGLKTSEAVGFSSVKQTGECIACRPNKCHAAQLDILVYINTRPMGVFGPSLHRVYCFVYMKWVLTW